MKKLSLLLVVFYAFQSQAAVTETEFNQVLDKLHAIYQPKVEAMGKAFTIQKQWSDATVNAYASNWPDRFIVTVLGGIARHNRTTPDALAVIACHEIGFLLGGTPKSESPAEWASAIGQADYFATVKCMKKYLADEDNAAVIRSQTVPAVVTTKCAEAYESEADRALCARSSLAAIALGNLLGDLSKTTVNIETPSTVVVDQTLSTHPEVQCRLDNFFAGSLCNVDAEDGTYCADGTLGGRSRCWYAPGN